ncbi:MAG: PAS domain S-box protein [Bacteroidota bacterium]
MENLYKKMIAEVEDYAIILLDKDGTIQNWNAGAQKIKQYSSDEIIGKNFRIFYLPEDQQSGLPEKLLAEAANVGKATHEGWRVQKSGGHFWGSIVITALHSDDGKVIGFSKVTRDLTEKKLVEDQLKGYADELQQKNESLRKSEERYHQMIAEVEDYAIILLDEAGTIRNWNAGAQKIKQYTADEIIGKNFRVFYLPGDQQSGLPEKLIAEAANKGKAMLEGWRVRKDGTHFWGSIVITALHNQEGNIIGYSKVTRDLTERKLSEEKVEIYLKELEAQNYELEHFAYVAAHDLQEPLRKIRTFIEIIQKNLGNEALAGKYFEKINAAARRMGELVSAVLNYSRIDKDNKQITRVDLNEVLKKVLEDFELSIQEKQAKIFSDKLPSIEADELQVNQVFSNLISNALKYAGTTPEIKIFSTVVSSRQIKNAVNEPDSDYLQIVFEDNGIGFEPQYETVIFHLFKRLHGRQDYAGTGIGLALCKRIMDKHGGHISAKGEVNKGAKFYLHFPLS